VTTNGEIKGHQIAFSNHPGKGCPMTRPERPEVLLRKLLEADGIEIIIRKCTTVQARRRSEPDDVVGQQFSEGSVEELEAQRTDSATVRSGAVRPMLSIKHVLARVPFSKSTLLRMAETGQFPRPHKVSSGRVAWFEEDVLSWQTALEDLANRKR
jgi:predicted DNA-binding transcriptional regulator AlpA